MNARKFASVPNRYNGPELEGEILKFWEANSIFQKTLHQSRGRPRFSFNEGPPTANGKPGIHHVLARAFKDIYPRYKTMRGYYAPRKGGWDTHGLPVEHEIEKQLGVFDKKEIEARVGIAEFTRLCRESVMAYIGDWEKMTRRMGYWVSLEDAYYTLDNRYIESVWNLLQQIWNKDLIYKGYKVVPYDPRIGATLSSHEVAQGYREVEDPAVTVRFPILQEDAGGAKSPPAAFLVWTTTPWTLPSNLLLAVRKDLPYVRVSCRLQSREHHFILARARVEAVLRDIPHKIISEIKGAELVGTRYQRIFDAPALDPDTNTGEPFRVVAADFVSDEEGTGIVHVAPAYGVDDLELGRREGVSVLHGVGLDGCFKDTVPALAGKFFKDADPPIIADLKKRDLLLRDEKVMHNYPFGWRTGDPLIYYAKEAWYIKTTAIKQKMVDLNQTINWVPQTIRDGRFGNWIANNVDWALSRERFWGTPLPLWQSEDGDLICIGSRKELETLVGKPLGDIDLHRPSIDEITFVKNGKTYTRVPEVIDCWFDSGAMPYAQWGYPFENQEEFASHFPADYVCEAIDQTRGWFYTLHAIAALVSDSVSYKNCVCLSHIVDQHGKKMSKSQGNIVDPYDVFDHVGADPLRWLFLARTAPQGQKRISVDIVREVASSFVNTFWNTYAFFILYARLDQVDLAKPVPYTDRPQIDRWILALTHDTLRIVTAALDEYDAKTAGQAIEKLVSQLSNWYVRRNRRRFWKNEPGTDKQAAYLTLFECLDLCHRMLAPFMPFLSEAVYRNLHSNDKTAAESIHLTAWPPHNPDLLDAKLVLAMDMVQQVVELGRTAREQSRIRIRQPLARILVGTTNPKARQAIAQHQDLICEELNIKSLHWIQQSNASKGKASNADASLGADLIRRQIKPNFPRLGKRYGKLMPAIKATLTKMDNTPQAASLAAQIEQQQTDGKTFTLQISEIGNKAQAQAQAKTKTKTKIQIEPGDLQVQTTSADGYSCARNPDFLVALDTTLTEPLRVEGIMREIIRTIQDARKSANLEISDRIKLRLSGSARIQSALQVPAHRQTIMDETLAQELSLSETKTPSKGKAKAQSGEFTTECKFEDNWWSIALHKTPQK